jgi:AcrR family transcriptional regulator
MGRTRETSEARQRLLETADRLFYQDGIRAVGIDRIIAEAGVAKMSLYKHFPSKDDLILAVLKYREECVLEFFRSAMERHGKKAKNPLRAFFAALKDFFESPGFRGCPFQNAAVELADPTRRGFGAAPSRTPPSNWPIPPTPAPSSSVGTSSVSASSCEDWSKRRFAKRR